MQFYFKFNHVSWYKPNSYSCSYSDGSVENNFTEDENIFFFFFFLLFFFFSKHINVSDCRQSS